MLNDHGFCQTMCSECPTRRRCVPLVVATVAESVANRLHRRARRHGLGDFAHDFLTVAEQRLVHDGLADGDLSARRFEAFFLVELRKEKRRRQRRRDLEDEVYAWIGGTPEDSAADREAETRLMLALAALPSAQQELLILRFVDEARWVVVAAALGISAVAARQRFFRLARRLRHLLSGE